MGPLFPDGNSDAGFSSTSSSLRPSSSQSSRPSMETPSDSLGTGDSLQHSLGSSWASYLSAQHSSRELSALKRSVNEQIDSVKASTRSLQQEALRHQNLVATTLSEFREKVGRATSDLSGLRPLQDSLPALRQELQSHREQTSKSLVELSDNFSALQEKVDGVESLASRDTKTAQDRYGAALKTIEFLQGELKVLTAEKIALENKLSAVERKVETLEETNHRLPEATIEFLASIFSRRDDLLKLLNKPDVLAVHQPPIPAEPDTNIGRVTRAASRILERSPEENIPKVPVRKRKEQHRPPPAPTSANRNSSSKQDMGALLSKYKQEYKAHPPGSDVRFIWFFLDDIEDEDASKHVQTWLATAIPKYVTLKRGLRSHKAKDGRHINIRPGLTWKEFLREVLKTPPLPG
ncbi:hypothetical protein QBC39DRAFT_429643 [Podospora conica]|nr:hypothetical protein QBC39DRAFT_429643 [Schizothecium conicum]